MMFVVFSLQSDLHVKNVTVQSYYLLVYSHSTTRQASKATYNFPKGVFGSLRRTHDPLKSLFSGCVHYSKY